MIKLVKKYMRGSWGWAIAAPLCMLLEVYTDLMQPALMADIIDIGVANGDVGFIVSAGFKMMMYAIVGLTLGLGCVAAASIASTSFAERLRRSFFSHIQTFSYEDLDIFKSSSLITRMTNDIVQIQQMVMMALRMMVRSPFLSIGGVIMAYRLSPSLSLALVVAVPLLLLVTVFLMRRALPMFMTMQTKIDKINGIVRENLLGVKVVKSFVSQEQEIRRFGEANDDLMSWSIRAMRNMNLLFPLGNFFMNMSVVAILWFGGTMAINGTLETGKIMAFINYLIQIMSSLTMVVMMSMNLSRAQVATQRINEVLDTQPGMRDGGTMAADEAVTDKAAADEAVADGAVADGAAAPAAAALAAGMTTEAAGAVGDVAFAAAGADTPTGSPSPEAAGYDIEFRDVSFRYHNSGEWVLKHIDLTIREGETVGIIGTTGSGKSTLASLIPRLYEATEGSVLVGGRNVRDYPLAGLRKKIGMVLQDTILFAGTVEDNLRFGKEAATEDELREAAEDAQALSFILEKERGFRARVEQRGRNFSGGQRQRLSIARTLIRKPEILILDDAASAVDLVTEAKIREAINRRIGSCTVIIIAQRIAAVRDAGLILVMNEGEIEARGTHEELLRSSEVYRHVVAAQLGEEAVAHAG